MKIFALLLALSFVNFCNAQFVSEDDTLHFGAGFIISGGTYAYVYTKTKNKKKAFWYSLAASTLVGFSKEFYDGHIIDGRFDTGEMIATSMGGLVASTTLQLFVGKKKKETLKKVAIVN
ncbi:hypothetical protein [uncultured Algibacter sp.]|uniref:hypothetical protein n=1 Tax=uncultured Algibacter sp. TaxID=298659 RepID=UPI002616ADCE|nr:hypothetical protein [uncultured Algibacter sp.]